jgi:hypothetical protein
MLLHTPSQYSPLLVNIAESLDIPDHLYENAVVEYENVGSWLAAETSALAPYSPEIYPQGSFRLGTVVRPVAHEDEYDIDLVCHLRISKQQTTQAELKKMVGDRLKKRQDLRIKLEESRRCWNLTYPKSFHMDVLPCIPNSERLPTGILLTDTELTRWQKSNPVRYADWFKDRMRVALELRKSILAESRRVDVEQVPEWQVRTPLQRVVQILKRHRDMYFNARQKLELRPVSIILTTLAAQAYSNEEDLYESLEVILAKMADGIEKDGGKHVVRNPVEPDENFADKWNEKPELWMAFYAWLDAAQKDFTLVSKKATLSEAVTAMMPMFGDRVMKAASAKAGLPASALAVSIGGATPDEVPPQASTGHVQRPPWPMYLQGKASIKGSVYSSNKKKKLWEMSSRSLPKNVSLKFVLSTNVRQPYEVRWQIVNTGAEAAAAGQLRGGFERNQSTTHWESTLFAGTHWVEAFILKAGACVAHSGKLLVQIRK